MKVVDEVVNVQNVEELFLENMNLVYFAVNKHYSYLMNDEDIIQEGMIGLYNACLKYDPSRSKFSTYAVTCILNEIRMELRRRDRLHLNEEVSLSTPVDEDNEDLTLLDVLEDPKDHFEDLEVSIFLETMYRDLSETDKQVLFYLFQGYKQTDIANRLKCTRANVSRIKRKFLKKFQNTI